MKNQCGECTLCCTVLGWTDNASHLDKYNEAAKYDVHTIGVRPEHIDVVESGGQWQGTVGVAEHLGSDTFFHIHNTGLTEMLTVRAIGDVSLTHGDTIHLTPRTGEIHRFDAGGLRIA